MRVSRARSSNSSASSGRSAAPAGSASRAHGRRTQRHGLPGTVVGAPPGGGAERRRARLEQAERGEELAEGHPRLGQRRRLAGPRLGGEHDERVRLVVLAARAPDGVRGSLEEIAAHERHTGAELPALACDRHADQGREHRVHGGVLVDDRLELAVGALEAVALELEGARRPPTRERGSARAPPRRGRARPRAHSSRPSRAGSRRRPRCAPAPPPSGAKPGRASARGSARGRTASDSGLYS